MLNNYFITVTSDQIDLNEKIVSAHKIISRRIKRKKFPIYDATTYRDKIKVGDICYMYLAGQKENKHHILGSFKVKEIILNERIVEFDDVLSSIPYKYLVMGDAKVFAKPLYVKAIIEELEFIKNKIKWGVFFQGGIRKIGENDMKLLERKVAIS